MRPTEFRELMEEPPGGHNAGRAASSNPNVDGRWVELDPVQAQVASFMRDGGWTVVHAKNAAPAGMTAHRGVLQSDEYVDRAALLAAVEAEFGFTVDDVRAVYRQGRLSNDQRELRGSIDARLLALSRSGTNMLALARVFGLAIDPERGCQTITRALRRAKAAELANPKEAR